jgi:PKD repeat protein
MKVFGALLVSLAVLAAAASPAAALVVETPTGPIGYLPLERAPRAGGAALGSTPPKGAEPPLLYHGGPVMHSQTAYAIFWAPSGYSFPSGYRAGIETYLQNVAADSGKPSNVYSVSAQYTDGTGHATYSDSFGGSVTDENAYPTSGTCPTYSGAEAFTACISDKKLEDQVELVVAAQGWPTGLGAEYYVVLPPHAGSCFDAAGTSCFDKQFCAYHSYSEPEEEIYANISYSPGDPFGCGVGEYPNGHENGNVDDTLSGLSHEANESITDPLLSAWFDKKGFENGDECRNSSNDYGTPLGGSSGALFNQAIGAGHYFLQREWSNDVEDCAQRVTPATPAISGPEEAAPEESLFFDGSGSTAGAGGIVSYAWKFGDGSTASGPTASHSYASSGVYTVTLTVKDDGAFSYSTTHEVTVAAPNPQRTLTVVLPGGGSGIVTGSGISCSETCTHKYADGESVTLNAAPSPGSIFSGWSGESCTGTGSCELTMSADREVTATFTGLRVLTVSLDGEGSGSVTGSGISCPATCSHSYPSGESVTLAASPAAGSTFTGWSGAGCGGTGVCSVTMSAAEKVTGTFALVPPIGEDSGGSESQAGPAAPVAVSTPVLAPLVPTRAVKCRKGFRRVRKRGKAVCVKVKKHRKHR